MISKRDSIFKAIEAEETPKKIFVIEERDGKFVMVRDPNMSQVERKLRSTRIPTVLQENHLTTARQNEEDGVLEMIPNTLYEVEFPSGLGEPGEIGSVIKLTMERLQEMGLLEEFLEARRELLNKDTLPLLAKISQEEQSGYERIYGSVYQTSLTRNPKSDPSSIHLSKLQRRQDEWNGKSINTRLMKLVSKATRMVIPNSRCGGREKRWHTVASMTPYWEDNHEVTSIQLNFTPQATSITKSLRKFAVGHADTSDDATGYSGLCVMGHFDADHFGGRFNLTPLGLTTVLGKCDLLLFPAKLWLHCSSGSGTYDVPPGDPRRLQPSPLDHLTTLPAETPYMRLNAVVFPNKRCLNPEWRQIHPELWGEKGRSIYATTALHQEWMMRLWITNESEIMHWIQKAVGEDFQDLDHAEDKATLGSSLLRDFEGKGPDLLTKATEFMTKKFRHQLAQWKEDNMLKAKAIDDKAEEDAREKGLECQDPKVKADRLQKERAANRKARAAYTSKAHEFLPVEKKSASYYCCLFGWVEENTQQLLYPSEVCAKMTLEWCNKPNKEFKNLLDKSDYLDCGSRVFNQEGSGGHTGKVKIPSVSWLNPNFHKGFDSSTDTIPGNPSWIPEALGGEEMGEDDECIRQQKRSHLQAFDASGTPADPPLDFESEDLFKEKRQRRTYRPSDGRCAAIYNGRGSFAELASWTEVDNDWK